MKNKILIAVLMLVGLALVNNAYAIGQNGLGHESGDQATTDTATPVQQKVQLKLQDGSAEGSQTQNQGELKQVQNNEQQELQTKNQADTSTGVQVRRQVANAVQVMLQIAERNDGFGEQVRVIAQSQNENQQKIEASLQKVEARSKFSKFLIGPKYTEINSAKKILEQNRELINQLDQIQNQLTNQDDALKLTEQVQMLEKTNLEVENSLNSSEKGFSLLGWMFKMFSK